MPPKKEQLPPLLVALAVTVAHHNSGFPKKAAEVVAAKVIGVSRSQYSDTFSAYATNEEGSVIHIVEQFVGWLICHTENPVCVIIDQQKFSHTDLGRMICLMGRHLQVLDLVPMAAGQALDLTMAIQIANTINHGVVRALDGHIPPHEEVDFIEAQLKERFKGLLPVAMRRRLNKDLMRPVRQRLLRK